MFWAKAGSLLTSLWSVPKEAKGRLHTGTPGARFEQHHTARKPGQGGEALPDEQMSAVLVGWEIPSLCAVHRHGFQGVKLCTLQTLSLAYPGKGQSTFNKVQLGSSGNSCSEALQPLWVWSWAQTALRVVVPSMWEPQCCGCHQN